MGFLHCIIYLLSTQILLFFTGRLFPRKWLKPNSFPFRAYKCEKGGRIYEKIHIQKWKTKLPDASVILNKIIPGIMPKKRLDVKTRDKMQLLVKESCIAEANHAFAALTGFVCVRIWRKTGGWIVAVANFVIHVPFVLIQRYNRPRLQKMVAKMDKVATQKDAVA
ncbi:MAG: hypothetical protein IJX23_05930 [Clostridia bacterium]|nr:hypothetical protein [Clostridia bacterium]